MGTERDSHFAGFAELLYPDLARLFAVMQEYMTTGEENKAKMVETVIKDVIACRAYDLACSNVECISETMAADISVGDLTVQECVNVYVPDLTEWPK